ncbi:hypothetical protein JXB01_00585 [Candidatus Micrarchaeota archaeon]|nr:hypothetical protein [Candidatus Micrarchaeota archaeon]
MNEKITKSFPELGKKIAHMYSARINSPVGHVLLGKINAEKLPLKNESSNEFFKSSRDYIEGAVISLASGSLISVKVLCRSVIDSCVRCQNNIDPYVLIENMPDEISKTDWPEEVKEKAKFVWTGGNKYVHSNIKGQTRALKDYAPKFGIKEETASFFNSELSVQWINDTLDVFRFVFPAKD